MAGNEVTPTSIPDTASAMEGLLDRMDAAPEGDAPADAEGTETQAAETTEAEPTAAETAEAPESAEVAAEGEEAPAEEEAEDAQPPAPRMLTVKIDGKVAQVSETEAAAGYQRQADYSRKTADLAEQRRAFEAERQSVSAERAQYQQMLTALQGQLQQMQPQRPDRTLLDSDPIEYTRQQAIWQDHQERLQAAQYEQQRVQNLQMQERQGLSEKQIAENRQKMIDAVPTWKDQTKWQADRPKLLEYGKKLGFSDQELSQASDYRAVVALNDGRWWRGLAEGDPSASAAANTLIAKWGSNPRNAPRQTLRLSPRTAPAGSANTAPRAVSALTRQKQRLAQTGKVSDAAALLENLDL